MKLSKLYSNTPDVFDSVSFNSGLNVILAEIRLPENKKKDTHNLGKSTLGRLIDFCLLSSRENDFFLFKHYDLFKNFVFFIEVTLLNGKFVTVRRSVERASKISFKQHAKGNLDLTNLPDAQWDHFEVPFEKAINILDGVLDLSSLKPWSYRKGIGYLLRSQEDFQHVFRLGKFEGKHSDWKPFLAHILGFDDKIIEEHYSKEEELAKKKEIEETLKTELGGSLEDLSKIEGMLLLKQEENKKKQQFLDIFDFRFQDKEKTKQLVNKIDEKIANLNSERYYLNLSKKKIESALEEDQIFFNPSEAEQLFKETGVLFKGQIKRDYEQLIAFNRAITEERRSYLAEESVEIESSLRKINQELNELGKERSEALSFLSSADAFVKYKKLSEELVYLKADITSLERRREYILRLQNLRKDIRSIMEEKERLQVLIEQNVEVNNSSSNSLFSLIRLFFSEIIEGVIDRKALLTVSPNGKGHLDFKTDILDESGNSTSASLGHTYLKLLCIAFDMAVSRAHIKDKFPRFLFHDGIFESLDDRKKENLLKIIRDYCEDGIQHIITLIDSDLPVQSSLNSILFEDSEIIMRLHDEDEKGRLFKMQSW